MTDLRELPGIGSGLAAELRAVGIRDAEALRTLGAPEAARRLAELGLREAGPTQQVLAAALRATPAGTHPPERGADTELHGGAGDPGPGTHRAEPVLGVESVVFTVGDLGAALDHYVRGLGLPVTHRSTDPPSARLRLGDGTAGLWLREDPAAFDTTGSDPAAAATAPRVRLTVGSSTAAEESLRSAGLAVSIGPDGREGATALDIAVAVTDRWGNVVELVAKRT